MQQCIIIASCKLLWAHCIQIFRGASSRCALECILDRIAFPHIASESSCTIEKKGFALECIATQCRGASPVPKMRTRVHLITVHTEVQGRTPQCALECISHQSATEGTARPPRASQNILEHPPHLLLHHSSYNRISFFIPI